MQCIAPYPAEEALSKYSSGLIEFRHDLFTHLVAAGAGAQTPTQTQTPMVVSSPQRFSSSTTL